MTMLIAEIVLIHKYLLNTNTQVQLFNSIFEKETFEIYILIFQLFLILLSFSMLIRFVYNSIKIYEKKVLDLYSKKQQELQHELEFNHDYLQNTIDAISNILIVTDGKNIKRANQTMLDFLGYENLDNFKQEHSCICDCFIKQENTLMTHVDELTWLDYMLQHPTKTHFVAMKHNDKIHRFIAQAQKLPFEQIQELLCVVTFTDITEMETIKNKLKQKDEMILAQSRQAAMGDMISMIAHQWRQPITAISMGAQNMQLDIELEDINPERFDEKLTKIVEQTAFLSHTIDDFRDFLKPNKKLDVSKISDIINSTLGLIGKSLQNNNISVEKTLANDLEIVTYNSELIQVLLNILNNSKDIISIKKIDNATIKISIDNDDKNVYFYICDNAGGIADDVLPRIFEPYFTTKDEKGGTGLGLYMSQMIVKKHLNGTIKAKNIKDGACFTITLPLKNNHGE
jgi:signal transduction histidine kinase